MAGLMVEGEGLILKDKNKTLIFFYDKRSHVNTNTQNPVSFSQATLLSTSPTLKQNKLQIFPPYPLQTQ